MDSLQHSGTASVERKEVKKPMVHRMEWLDSLRVLAMAAVIFYHFFPKSLPAGFFGVDVLFVLSGFLITATLLDEMIENKTFSLRAFFERRVVRLLPPLALLLLIILPLALFIHPDFLVDFRRQLAAVFGFTTNWYEIFTGGSYESQYIKHLFLHTWSLGPELRFYILWAVALKVMARQSVSHRYGRRKREPSIAGRLRVNICFTSAVLFMGMTLLQWLLTLFNVNTSFRYFADVTRMAPFFVGSFVAGISGFKHLSMVFLRRAQKQSSLGAVAVLISVPVLLFVMAKCLDYTSAWTYVLGFPLVALLSGAFLYCARLVAQKPHGRREPEAIRFLAKLTYPLYLFHWPFFVLLERHMSQPLAAIVAFLLALFLSLCNEFLWQPLWFHRPLRLGKQTKVLTSLQRVAILTGCFCLFLFTSAAAFHREPAMLQMEQQVWSNGLEQDWETMQGLHDTVADQSQALREAKQKKEAAQLQKKVDKQKITLIGDSVSLVVRSSLVKNIPNLSVDGAVSRFLHQGADILQQKAKGGSLGHIVVIALGTNIYPNYQKQYQRILDALPNGHRLIFVTPFDKSKDRATDSVQYTNFLRNVDKPYYVTLADWAKISQEHPEYYEGTDGVHFYGKDKAIAHFVSMLKTALQQSMKQPAKGEK